MKIRDLIRKSFAAQMVLPSFLTLALSLLLIILVNLYHTREQLKELKFEKLSYELDVETASIENEIDNLVQDVQFLASVPPIEGILRATNNNGIDPLDGSTLEQWEERLKVIFKEILQSHDDYLQARYVGFHNHGKELVRVDRMSGKVKATSQKNLQFKDIESYFKEILKTPPGTPFLSSLTLNRENGKITEPRQLMIRVAIPVHQSKNKPFGFVIINMAADNLFDSVYKLISEHKQVYITNDENKDLSPIVFAKDKKTNINLVRPNTKKYLVNLKNPDAVTRAESADSFIVARKIHYDKRKPEKFIGIIVSTSSEDIYNEIFKQMFVELLLSFVLILISLLLSFYYLRRESKPLSLLKKLAIDIAHGKEARADKRLEQREDEMGEVAKAFNFMASEIEAKNSRLQSQKKALDETAIVSETDLDGAITYVNPRFTEKTGYTLQELKGKNHRIIKSGHHPKSFYKNLWDTIIQGKLWRADVCNKAKNGQLYWVDTTIVPSLDKAGKIKGYIAIRLDITEQKAQAEELKKLTETKSKFLSTMSHEIRNPLGAVIGLNELLSSTELNPQQRSYVDTITSSSNSLLTIINDILDFSKLESGKLNLVTEPVDLKALVQTIHQMFNQEASKKKIDFSLDIAEGIPNAVIADPIRIRQILTNFVSNAIKFTDQGSIEMHLKSEHKEGQTHKVSLSVKDTGIGLTEEQKKLIFAEYYQAETNHSKALTGTGLGLSICQRLVAAMGGIIQVDSELNSGSTFTVVVELQETNEKPLTDNTDQDDGLIEKLKEDQCNVLLAEDAEVNQSLFKAMMKAFGLEVTIVSNGEDAVNKAKENNFSLVFLDLQMPVLDGRKACNKIQENSKDKKPWFVALTGNVFKEDRLSCYENGFDDFLGKPYRKKELKHILLNYLDKHRALAEEFEGKAKKKTKL